MWHFFYKHISLLSLQTLLSYLHGFLIKACFRMVTPRNLFINLLCLTLNIFIKHIWYFPINLAYLIESIWKLSGNFVRCTLLFFGLFLRGILKDIFEHYLGFEYGHRIKFFFCAFWFVLECWFSLRGELGVYICAWF